MFAYYNEKVNEVNFFETELVEENGIVTLIDNKINISQSNIYIGCNDLQTKLTINHPAIYLAIISFKALNNNITFADDYNSIEEAYNACTNQINIKLQSGDTTSIIYTYKFVDPVASYISEQAIIPIDCREMPSFEIYFETTTEDVVIIECSIKLIEQQSLQGLTN